MLIRRPGITLIELLIVVAILALLVGLILPAVQSVRASAAAVTCTNNLRQLVLASQQCYTTRGRMPLGGGPFDATPAKQFPLEGSAHFFLLPFLEQGPTQSEIATQAYANKNAVITCGCWYHASVKVTRSTGTVIDLPT